MSSEETRVDPALHAAGPLPAVLHDTFTLSRRLDASPHSVFAAFADTAIRRRWLRLPGSGATYEHEFRVGAGETAFSGFTSMGITPERLEYRSRYIDIVEDRRIVFEYESSVDDLLRWTALVTILIEADGESTELHWTEQVAFLALTGDGSTDVAHLRGGTSLRLNGLAAALE